MRRFEADKWLNAVTATMQVEQIAGGMDAASPVPADYLQAYLVITLETVKSISKAHDFVQTYEHCVRAEERLGCDPSWPLLAHTLLHLRDLMESETRKRLFVSIPQDLRVFYNREKIFGKAVYKAFPSGRTDATAAGNCLATGNGTACVFHLMRTVEWGLRSLCRHFGFNRVKRTTKAGKVSFTPIAYVEWEAMLNQLHPKVDARIIKLKRGPDKQKEQEFYYQLLNDLQGFRDAWRNHVMHTRRDYEVGEATAVFTHVRRFLEALSARVGEL